MKKFIVAACVLAGAGFIASNQPAGSAPKVAFDNAHQKFEEARVEAAAKIQHFRRAAAATPTTTTVPATTATTAPTTVPATTAAPTTVPATTATTPPLGLTLNDVLNPIIPALPDLTSCKSPGRRALYVNELQVGIDDINTFIKDPANADEVKQNAKALGKMKDALVYAQGAWNRLCNVVNARPAPTTTTVPERPDSVLDANVPAPPSSCGAANKPIAQEHLNQLLSMLRSVELVTDPHYKDDRDNMEDKLQAAIGGIVEMCSRNGVQLNFPKAQRR